MILYGVSPAETLIPVLIVGGIAVAVAAFVRHRRNVG